MKLPEIVLMYETSMGIETLVLILQNFQPSLHNHTWKNNESLLLVEVWLDLPQQ